MIEQDKQSSISTPLKKNSGSNYYSERLVVRGNIIEVRPTKRHSVLMAFFAVFGLLIATIPSFAEWKIIWTTVACGIFFLLIGSFFLIAELRKARPLFNLSLRQLFPKGLKHPNLAVPLNTVSYLEVLGKIVNAPNRKDRSQKYPCYELNAVFQNDERHNILNHGNLRKLREDARLLADILNIQIQEENLNPEASLPPPSRFNKWAFAILLPLFGLGFLASGCFTLWMLCITPLYYWNDSRHWTTVPAVIVHSSLDTSPPADGQRINIRYDYEFDGHTYQGKLYDFFRSDSYSSDGNGSSWQAVADNPVGSKTQCLVNPNRPEEAVLSRTIPRSHFIWFFFPLPFIAVGLFFSAFAVKSFFTMGARSASVTPVENSNRS